MSAPKKPAAAKAASEAEGTHPPDEEPVVYDGPEGDRYSVERLSDPEVAALVFGTTPEVVKSALDANSQYTHDDARMALEQFMNRVVES